MLLKLPIFGVSDFLQKSFTTPTSDDKIKTGREKLLIEDEVVSQQTTSPTPPSFSISLSTILTQRQTDSCSSCLRLAEIFSHKSLGALS